jgi:hypothetical protein
VRASTKPPLKNHATHVPGALLADTQTRAAVRRRSRTRAPAPACACCPWSGSWCAQTEAAAATKTRSCSNLAGSWALQRDHSSALASVAALPLGVGGPRCGMLPVILNLSAQECWPRQICGSWAAEEPGLLRAGTAPPEHAPHAVSPGRIDLCAWTVQLNSYDIVPRCFRLLGRGVGLR